MSEFDTSTGFDESRRAVLNQTAMYAAIAAALMLFFGFLRPYDVAQGTRLYVTSVFATNWLLRIGGLSLLGAAILCWSGLTVGLAVDALVSAIVGLALSGVGIIWISDGDYEGLLFLIFALLFLSAARHSWTQFVALSRTAASRTSVKVPEPPTPPVEGLKESARDRLLQAKANLRQTPPAPSTPVARPMAEQPGTPPPPPLQSQDAAPGAAPASGPPVPTPPAPQAETVEEGFLAELGRSNHDERK